MADIWKKIMFEHYLKIIFRKQNHLTKIFDLFNIIFT